MPAWINLLCSVAKLLMKQFIQSIGIINLDFIFVCLFIIISSMPFTCNLFNSSKRSLKKLLRRKKASHRSRREKLRVLSLLRPPSQWKKRPERDTIAANQRPKNNAKVSYTKICVNALGQMTFTYNLWREGMCNGLRNCCFRYFMRLILTAGVGNIGNYEVRIIVALGHISIGLWKCT